MYISRGIFRCDDGFDFHLYRYRCTQQREPLPLRRVLDGVLHNFFTCVAIIIFNKYKIFFFHAMYDVCEASWVPCMSCVLK
jgi:hypothetical protein